MEEIRNPLADDGSTESTTETINTELSTDEESSYEEESSYISDTSDDEDRSTDNDMSGAVDENTCILRGKWLYDGSKSIDDMIGALEKEIMLLKQLKDDGWEVDDEVQDDYAYLCKESLQENDEENVENQEVVA